MPAATRLCKFLSKESKARIGALARLEGGFTTLAEETMELLFQKHFPESITVSRTRTIDHDTATRVVTSERVVWSIIPFPPYKLPGKDDICPALAHWPHFLSVSFEHAWQEATFLHCEGIVLFIPNLGQPY